MEKQKSNNIVSEARKNLYHSLVYLIGVIITGTIGYMLIEKWDLLDAFYMTIISITTTGFREVQPLSDTGKLFTVVIVIFGFSTLAYAAGRGAQYLFEYGLFWRRKMKKRIENMKNHTIVCGFGRMGKEICRMLWASQSPFIIIDHDETAIEEVKTLDYTFLQGNANEDETLLEAGIDKAKSLIAVLSTDADNVYTVLTARGLNAHLKILARAVSESTESKLIKAGANRVILPYLLGGRRIAFSLLKPELMDFIDLLNEDNDLHVQLDSITLKEKSELVNLELATTFIRADLDIIVVMIIREDHSIVYNPRGSTVLKSGDRLIAIGNRENLQTLITIANGH